MKRSDKFLVVHDPCDGCVKLRDESNKGIQSTRHPKLAIVPISEEGSAWRCNACSLLWLVDPKEKLWIQAALCPEDAIFEDRKSDPYDGISLVPTQILKHPAVLTALGAASVGGFLTGKFGHKMSSQLRLAWEAGSKYIIPMLPAPAQALLEHNPAVIDIVANILEKQVDIVTPPDMSHQQHQLAQFPMYPPGYNPYAQPPYPQQQPYPQQPAQPPPYPQQPPQQQQPAQPQQPPAQAQPTQPPYPQQPPQQPNPYAGWYPQQPNPFAGWYPPVPPQPVAPTPATVTVEPEVQTVIQPVTAPTSEPSK